MQKKVYKLTLIHKSFLANLGIIPPKMRDDILRGQENMKQVNLCVKKHSKIKPQRRESQKSSKNEKFAKLASIIAEMCSAQKSPLPSIIGLSK